MGRPESLEDRTLLSQTLFFSANDGTNGVELWKTDGATAGTVLVKNINPGSASSLPRNNIEYKNLLFFTADDGTNGRELWKSDGTTLGTVMVKNISGGVGSSDPRDFTIVGTTLFFTALDGNGRELWKTDGTTLGTVMVKDINPGSNPGGVNTSDPGDLVNLNGTLVFTAIDGIHSRELWKSDGTTLGTVLVKDIRTGTSPAFVSPPLSNNLTVVGTNVLFTADDGTNGRELWKSNGTTAGTVLVKNIMPGGTTSHSIVAGDPTSIDHLAIGLTFYFAADDGTNGRELWKSDGTTLGTVMVKNIYVPRAGESAKDSNPRRMANFNGTLFFAAGDRDHGEELWKSNGTAAGTVLVKDIFPDPPTPATTVSSKPGNLTVVGSTLFFAAAQNAGVPGQYNFELWKTDGTTVGTVELKDINPGSASSLLGPGSLLEPTPPVNYFRVVNLITAAALAAGTAVPAAAHPSGAALPAPSPARAPSSGPASLAGASESVAIPEGPRRRRVARPVTNQGEVTSFIRPTRLSVLYSTKRPI